MFHFFGFSVQIKDIEEEKSKHARRNFRTCSKKFQNMLEEISKHARRDATETLKLKLKHPHSMFQLYNLLIINVFKTKNET